MKFSIGIDWSDKTHTVCIRELETRRILVEFSIEHSAIGIAQFEQKVEALGGTPEDCLVAIETPEGLLVNYLLDVGYRIHPIPPAAFKEYRGRRRRTGAKSDKDDGRLLSDILCQDLELYPKMVSDSPLARELRATYRAREQLVRQRSQVLSRLKRNLKTYFPVALDLFSGLERQIAREFLAAFPTQGAAQAASPAHMTSFLRKQGYKRTDKIPALLGRLGAPFIPVPTWQAEAGRRLSEALLAELAVLCQHIQQLEQRLSELLELHPDAAIFQSLPRVGPVLAAGFIGELGDCRTRFEQPGDLQALAGTAPVTIQSGPVKQVSFRFACNKSLRYLLQQFARQSARTDGSAWARAYISNQLAHGHSNSRAYRALVNRWLVIIFRIWQDRTLYNEHYHLRAIAQRGDRLPCLTKAA